MLIVLKVSITTYFLDVKILLKLISKHSDINQSIAINEKINKIKL